MRTVLFGRTALRMRRLVPTAKAPIPKPGVSNALNMEAIQQVQFLAEACWQHRLQTMHLQYQMTSIRCAHMSWPAAACHQLAAPEQSVLVRLQS